MEKTFDKIRREDIWKVLEKREVSKKTVELIKDMYRGNSSVLRTNNEESKEFETRQGVKQETQLTELMFADDMALMAGTEKDVQYNIAVMEEELAKINMKIKVGKTKIMIIARTRKSHAIIPNGTQIEQVEHFKYLGAIIEENTKIDKEINERMERSGNLFNIMKTTF